MNPFLETSTAIICSEKGQLTGRIKIDPQIAAARLMALKCGSIWPALFDSMEPEKVSVFWKESFLNFF